MITDGQDPMIADNPVPDRCSWFNGTMGRHSRCVLSPHAPQFPHLSSRDNGHTFVRTCDDGVDVLDPPLTAAASPPNKDAVHDH